MIARIVLALATAAALAACGSDRPNLGHTEHQVVTASPATWDFGAVGVGTQAAPRTVIVGVSGVQNQSYTILSITESCADFAVATGELPTEISRFCEACPTCAQAESAVCQTVTHPFDVYFTPTVAGPQACTITVQYDTGTKIVNVMGTGVAPDFDLTLLAPAGGSLAFGDVVVGQTSASLSILVRSDGTMPLDVTSADFNGTGDPSQFSVGGIGAFTLQPGDTREITVACTPTAPGPTGAGFAIISNDPAESVVTVDFSCNGIQSNLAINPSPAQFPETFVGDTSSRVVSLINSGSAAMVLESIDVTPAQFSVTFPEDPSIPVMGVTDVDVDFTADDSVVDQDVQGQLTVTYDGGETRTIDLIGPARSAILSVTPGGEVDFGTVCAGRSERRLFAAINLGSGEFELSGAGVSGDGFSITLQPSFPAELPARGGATATLEVTAMPPEGEVTGTLTLTPDVPNLSPESVTLRARGQVDGIAANPGAVAFETVVVDEGSGGREVRLTNCEDVPLAVSGADVVGTNAAEFTAVSVLPLPGMIPAYGTATWLVELTPTSAGEKSANLVITHDGGETSILLTGLGIDEAPDEDRGSYYACSSSDPHNAALILFSLLLLFLPRRRRA